MRLLDDIGWAQHQPAERFDLTISPDQLRATLQRLHDHANRHAHRLLSDTQAALARIDAYAAMLGQITERRRVVPAPGVRDPDLGMSWSERSGQDREPKRVDRPLGSGSR